MPLVFDQFDDWVTYVPDVAENRLEPVPMTVEIQGLSTAEYKAIQRKWGPRLQGKHSFTRAQRMVEKVILERVRNVQNCTVVNHTTGESFALGTAEDVLRYGPAALIDDLFEAITDASSLSAGLKKNLGSQSDSSTARNRPSAGIAEPAKEKAESKPTNQGGKPSAGSETATGRQTLA